jgi:shikimate dehydrogenase
MPKTAGLIGFPLGHSISPAMHNAAYKKLGLDFIYVPFEVPPDDLREALAGLRALHMAGFNVTIPHKESILPLLDDITPVAKRIGAVNTVVNQEGRLVGYNTDGPGFIESLKADAHFDPQGKSAVILGAGGASRAVAVMLAEAGASEITLSDVIETRASLLAEYLIFYAKTTCYFAGSGSPELTEKIAKADLLVNASPAGMYPKIEESPLAENLRLPSNLTVYDLVYNPAETKLLITAKAAGARTCSGLGMLVRQGALAFTLFTGEEAPVNVMWEAAQRALALSNTR